MIKDENDIPKSFTYINKVLNEVQIKLLYLEIDRIESQLLPIKEKAERELKEKKRELKEAKEKAEIKLEKAKEKAEIKLEKAKV